MKITEVKTSFIGQFFKVIQRTVKDGDKVKIIKEDVGNCIYAVRFGTNEYVKEFGEPKNLTSLKDNLHYFHCQRNDLKKLTKYVFEKVTKGGFPIFQTRAYTKEFV